MTFKKEDLLKLKGKVKTIEELKEVAKEYNISYTEEELQEAYKMLAPEGELDLDDLEDVNGGTGVLLKSFFGLRQAKCHNCDEKIILGFNGGDTVCPKCQTVNNKNNCHWGC